MQHNSGQGKNGLKASAVDMQVSFSDPAWDASQKELAETLKNPDAAYEKFKAKFKPVAAGKRRLQGTQQMAEALQSEAHRKAAFLANVAFSAAENAKGTNPCATAAMISHPSATLFPFLWILLLSYDDSVLLLRSDPSFCRSALSLKPCLVAVGN